MWFFGQNAKIRVTTLAGEHCKIMLSAGKTRKQSFYLVIFCFYLVTELILLGLILLIEYDWLIDLLIDWLIDWLINWLIDWLCKLWIYCNYCWHFRSFSSCTIANIIVFVFNAIWVRLHSGFNTLAFGIIRALLKFFEQGSHSPPKSEMTYVYTVWCHFMMSGVKQTTQQGLSWSSNLNNWFLVWNL